MTELVEKPISESDKVLYRKILYVLKCLEEKISLNDILDFETKYVVEKIRLKNEMV